jgi:hypothetical protein
MSGEAEKAAVENVLGALLAALDGELTGLVKDLSRMRDAVKVVRTLAGLPEAKPENADEGEDESVSDADIAARLGHLEKMLYALCWYLLPKSGRRVAGVSRRDARRLDPCASPRSARDVPECCGQPGRGNPGPLSGPGFPSGS